MVIDLLNFFLECSFFNSFIPFPQSFISSDFISFFSLPSSFTSVSFYSMCLLIRQELKITTAHHPGKSFRTLSNSIKPMPDFSPIIFLSAVVLVLPRVSQLPNCRFFNNSILISPSSAQLSRTHSIRAQTLQLTWTNFSSPSSSRSCTSQSDVTSLVPSANESRTVFHQLYY